MMEMMLSGELMILNKNRKPLNAQLVWHTDASYIMHLEINRASVYSYRGRYSFCDKFLMGPPTGIKYQGSYGSLLGSWN